MPSRRDNVLDLICASLQRRVIDVEDLKEVAMNYQDRNIDAFLRTSALDLVVDALGEGVFTVEDLKEAAHIGVLETGYRDRMPPVRSNVPFDAGDWICGECGNHNFARRKECHRRSCGAPRPLLSSSRNGEFGMGVPPVGNSSGPKRSGDWYCECGEKNFAKRTVCFNNACMKPRPAQGDDGFTRRERAVSGQGGWGKARGPRALGGDWNCGSCGFSNFARRTECKDCGEPRSDNSIESAGAQRYNPYEHTAKQGRPGDWVCQECDMLNFARREVCHRDSCKAPRPEGVFD